MQFPAGGEGGPTSFGAQIASQISQIPMVPSGQPLNSGKVMSVFLNRFISPEFIENLINVLLYPYDFRAARATDVPKLVGKFLKDISNEIKRNQTVTFSVPKNIIQATIKIAQQILDLRDDISRSLITYDNVLVHFPKRDIHIERIIKGVKERRVSSLDQFRQVFDSILQTIQSFNEILEIRKTLVNWDQFIEQSADPNLSVYNLMKGYRDIVATSYNELSSLTTVTKNEQLTDYLVLHKEESVPKVVQNLVQFLKTGYSFYVTGYPLLDDNVGGLESSSVHIITGPSNHCKSIFMVNLGFRVVLNNIEMFEDGDAIVYITLEDDINKLLRRFISIFGNIDSELVKKLFIKISTLFKSQKDKDINNNSSLSSEVTRVLTELLTETIIKITKKKCAFILKHCNENVFSAADATKFIDMLGLEGYKTKILFLDYIDVMSVSGNSSKHMDSGNDYQAHGQITQELRLASRAYAIPIVTITQNAKASENTMNVLGNDQMGDSYRKVRYADYIYMCRLRHDLDLLNSAVKEHVLPPNQQNLSLVDLTGEFTQRLTPFEIKITKAKEGKKDEFQYHLFTGINLRVYANAEEFFADINDFKANSKWLLNNLELLGMNSIQMALPPTNESFETNLL